MRKDVDPMDRDQLRNAMDAEVKRVSALFRFIMKYQRHFQPSGVEFSGLRQYLPSDDASRIDWKNSAATPDLYVKQYEEEIDMDIFLILDVSDSMMFGTAEKLKSEYAAIVTAALAFASVDANINVGFMLKGDKQMLMTPQGGMARYQRLLDELTNFDHYGGTFNLEEALNETVGQIKENTAVFIISDFIDAEGDWKTKMALASMKFRHVMSIMVRDLRDYKMADSGNIRLESPDGSKRQVVNTSKIKDSYDKAAAEQEEKLEEKITGGGSGFMKIDTRDKFSAKFAEYFDTNQDEW